MVRKTRKCLVCKRPSDPDCGISFHILPKDKELRLAWVRACELDESYIYKEDNNYKICSEHFIESDFRITRIGGSRLLKPNVVPSVFMTEMSSYDISNVSQSFKHDHAFYSQTVTDFSPTENHEKIISPENHSAETLTNITDTEDSLISYLPEEIQNQKSPEPSMSEHSIRLITDSQKSTPRKRNIWRPSRIADCTPEHFSTPSRAKRNLDLVKSEVKHKQRKIKTLQQKNCRLLKKIETYENIIAHLRSEKLLPENVENILKKIHRINCEKSSDASRPGKRK